MEAICDLLYHVKYQFTGDSIRQDVERIEKELLLLRNLPMQYKLGQKKTALGRVIYVSLKLKSACMQ